MVETQISISVLNNLDISVLNNLDISVLNNVLMSQSIYSVTGKQ